MVVTKTYYKNGEASVTVKQGFSWPAFLFGFIWAYYKGLWGYGTILLLLNIVMVVVAQTLLHQPHVNSVAGIMINVIAVTISLYIGLKGNEWLAKDLQRKGYRYS